MKARMLIDVTEKELFGNAVHISPWIEAKTYFNKGSVYDVVCVNDAGVGVMMQDTSEFWYVANGWFELVED